MTRRMRLASLLAVICLLTACPSVQENRQLVRHDALEDDYEIVEHVPAQNQITLKTSGNHRKAPPAAVIFEVNENAEITRLVKTKGEMRAWKGLLDRFCRSEYAWDMVSRMIENIPDHFENEDVTEAALFSYLPFIYFQRETMMGKQDLAVMPAYCRACSQAWQKRLDRKRIAVLDCHGPDGQARDGYILVFSKGANAGKRFLEEIYRLQGDELTDEASMKATGSGRAH